MTSYLRFLFALCIWELDVKRLAIQKRLRVQTRKTPIKACFLYWAKGPGMGQLSKTEIFQTLTTVLQPNTPQKMWPNNTQTAKAEWGSNLFPSLEEHPHPLQREVRGQEGEPGLSCQQTSETGQPCVTEDHYGAWTSNVLYKYKMAFLWKLNMQLPCDPAIALRGMLPNCFPEWLYHLPLTVSCQHPSCNTLLQSITMAG